METKVPTAVVPNVAHPYITGAVMEAFGGKPPRGLREQESFTVECALGLTENMPYDQALEELHKWRAINIWAIDFTLIDGISTQEAINVVKTRLETDEQFRINVISALAEETATSTERQAHILKTGPDADLADRWVAIEEATRLDAVFAESKRHESKHRTEAK